MTLLVSWLSADDKPNQRMIAALYIAADSRISWNGNITYDKGQKVFASHTTNDIFGYCGDVLFCSSVIHTILDKINMGILSGNAQKRSVLIKSFLENRLNEYPEQFKEGINNSCILYGTRDKNKFYLFKYKIESSSITLKKEELEEYLIISEGSGSESFKKNWYNFNNIKNNDHGTSRNVFKCFKETIKTSYTSSVGGLPQIVSLYRGHEPRYIGIEENGETYAIGDKLIEGESIGKIVLYDEEFKKKKTN